MWRASEVRWLVIGLISGVNEVSWSASGVMWYASGVGGYGRNEERHRKQP